MRGARASSPGRSEATSVGWTPASTHTTGCTSTSSRTDPPRRWVHAERTRLPEDTKPPTASIAIGGFVRPAASVAATELERETPSSAALTPRIQLVDVRRTPCVAQEVLGEVLGPLPEPVVVHAPVAVALAGVEEEVEPLVGLDQRLGHPDRGGGVHVVVHIPRRQQQLPLQVRREFDVRVDVVFEA